jgi:hypothetical protein
MPVKKARDVSNLLLCPMPGTVLDFAVSEGQVVPPGGLLCVLEAMKMQVRSGVCVRLVCTCAVERWCCMRLRVMVALCDNVVRRTRCTQSTPSR